MTTPEDANRPEHNEQDEQMRDEAQVSSVSGLGDTQPEGGADATDKSTGTAPDETDQPAES